MYFSATLFALLNFTNPTATSILIALTNLLFTLLAFTLIDRLGRRPILLLTIPFMAIGLLLSAYSFSHILTSKPSSKQTSANGPTGYALLALTSLTVYVGAYALGIGTVPWTAQSELFKMQHRGLGAGIATAVNWAGNFIVGITFLGLLEGVGSWGVFGGYAGICVVGWVGVWLWFGERGGRELEDEDVY